MTTVATAVGVAAITILYRAAFEEGSSPADVEEAVACLRYVTNRGAAAEHYPANFPSG